MAKRPTKKTAKKNTKAVEIVETIEPAPFSSAISERYLSYALSTIMHRALPDVRDGLKPVHRRLLYAMRQLKLDPNSGFKKSARVVGDVIGKYHPHGDQSIYDALVRLAQDFSVRFPLIDGQGNFGNIDGDGAAAMRYTEARMTAVAEALLRDIDLETVIFRETYDGEELEPEVLPSAFPNLLANGSNGIAVGMATSIPPHNVGELCDALQHLIKTPNARVDTLLTYVKGPDLPTGGVCIEPQENILEAYKTGRGGFRIRAKWELEELGRGQWQVIITEIPFQVQKARLIEKIAEMMMAKKLPLLGDIRDESADDIRLVIEPRAKTVDPAVMMEQLFRNCELEVRIPLNMNVLDADHTPRVMNLAEVLRAFLDHRQDVLQRRTKFRLGKIEQRLEVLGGYLIAYLNLDEVIRIIREEDEPKKELIKSFKLTDKQAEAILNMRLRSLRKLEEMEIRTENKELTEEAKTLRALLKSEDKQWKTISEEIKALKADFGNKTVLGRRRTEIADAPDIEDVPLEDMIEKEPVTVILSAKGWVRTQKGHLDEAGRKKLKFKEGDKELYAVHAQTTDKMVAFGTNGRFYTLPVDRLPGGRGHGEPIRLLVDLPNDHDLLSLTVFNGKRKLLVVASDGRGFIVNEADVVAQTKNGKQVLNVKGDVEAQICAEVTDGADHIAIIGENRKLLVFPMKDEVPEMARGRGVILQRYKDGGVSDAMAIKLADGLPTPSKVFDKKELKDWMGTRAQAGRVAPRGFPRSNRFGK